ncbi:MAG: hypothetical protein AAFZ17_16970, partial [Cyanobacteria bacterium J06650_10]
MEKSLAEGSANSPEKQAPEHSQEQSPQKALEHAPDSVATESSAQSANPDTILEKSSDTQIKLELEKTLEKAPASPQDIEDKAPEHKPSEDKTSEDKTSEDKTSDSQIAEDKAEAVTVEKAIAEKQPKRKRFSRATILKAVAAVGLLATGSGFAVARTSPETLRTVLPTTDKPAPLSLASDPTAEPVMKAGDLFLTNQILYRKLEAIAGVSLTAPVQPSAPTATPSEIATG